MNFFEAQDDARRRTKWLVVYFILAIIGVILAVYGVVFLVMQYVGVEDAEGLSRGFWMPDVLLPTALITGGIMGVGSMFKTMQLSGGGAVVARDMGARQVDPHSTDTDEKRLINVVEEMAISSGVPVPQIWIMDSELGINAFAAGTEPSNAVVAVTRGCLQRLTRSELQGVIAHEFSHILNGDMKLNMRLMGLLFGIMMISMVGKSLFHTLRFVNVRGSSRNDKGGGGLVIALIVVAVGFMLIGGIGVFFGRMIQAAISRQREYLADASAVQFTRDSEGIAGALKKIGGQQYGSKIGAAKAAEASHLLFADGGMFSFGLATHPPLDVRINTLTKGWDGEFITTDIPDVAEGRGRKSNRGRRRDSRIAGMSDVGAGAPVRNSGANTGRVHAGRAERLGEPSEINVQVGQKLYDSLDESWIEACHDREEAQALVFGLLLTEDDSLRQEEILFVKKAAGSSAADIAVRWSQDLKGLHSSEKIALVDLSIPTLRRLTFPEYERFVKITKWLIASDGQVDLFEFMLQHVVERHLDGHFQNPPFTKIRYRRLEDLRNEANVIITTMAAVGGEAQMQSAYDAAIAESGFGGSMQKAAPSECGLDQIKAALEKFSTSTPLVKKQLLFICGTAVMHDAEVASREAELLRATADAIGCSIPPFVRN